MWQTSVQMLWRPSQCAFMSMTVTSIEKATWLSVELRALAHRSGFGLTRWVSNCKELMSSIPKSEWSKIWRMSISTMIPCHLRRHMVSHGVLKLTLSGFVSCPQRNLLQDEVSCRQCHHYMPQMAMGMAAAYVLTGKSIVHDCCRLKSTWNECLCRELVCITVKWTWYNGRDNFFHITSGRINTWKGGNQLKELFFLNLIFLDIHLKLTNHRYFMIKKNIILHNS